jgi:phage pi2 protein 07
MLKNVERNLGIRRSSRSKVIVYFEVMEWPSEIERGGGYLYPPQNYNRWGLKTSNISDHARICSMGDSN